MIENPILRGFCPDPSIIRVGEDYYIATSTFEWWPGVKLFHSKDLKHWKQISSPLRRESQLNLLGNPPSGGVWAPCLSYDGTYFFLIFTDVKTKKGKYYNTHNYMVYSKDIYGEWSEPVYLNSIGFDPSLFHDIDGRKYLINMINGFKGILVQELEAETWKLIGERKLVYKGSGIGCTEGPHMYHIGEWYYLLVAEGGTGYEHCVTLARSRSIWGPFETSPNNPILTSDRENKKELQRCGHADLVETPEGEVYMVHLCARPLGEQEWCTLGRETGIQKMHWNEEGWLELTGGGVFARTYVEEPISICAQEDELSSFYKAEHQKSPDFHADFTCKTLPVDFVSPRVSYENFVDLQSREGWLRIKGQESMNSLHRVSLLAVRQQEVLVMATTVVDFAPDYEEQLAGLAYMYDALNFYILGITSTGDGHRVLNLLKSDSGVITSVAETVELPEEGKVGLRAEVVQEGKAVRFAYRIDEWMPVGDLQTTEILTDEYCRGFTGAHFGLYVHDMTGLGYCADFERFDVLNATF